MQAPRLWLFEPIQQQASHVLPLPFQDRAQPLPSPLIVAKSLDPRTSPHSRRAFGSAASRQGASPGTQVVARPSHDRRQEHAPRLKENPRARQQEKTARRPTAIRQVHLRTSYVNRRTLSPSSANDTFCRISRANVRWHLAGRATGFLE